MIYFIEGCTCAGKSTLAQKISKEMNIPIAPEHTPAPLSETPSVFQRQEYIFADFLGQFCSMISSGQDYVADFSPWGVIPFSLAYADFQGGQDRELYDLANKQHQFLLQFKKLQEKHLQCITYLKADSNTIKERLKLRARAGDECWDSKFIELLVKRYNDYFDNWEISSYQKSEL